VADGVSTFEANAMLTTFTGAASKVALFDGNPGASGTSNPSSVTTKQTVTWTTPASAATSASNTPTWASWAGTNGETVTDVGFFDSSSDFLDSIQLSSSVQMFTGWTLELATVSVSFTPAS